MMMSGDSERKIEIADRFIDVWGSRYDSQQKGVWDKKNEKHKVRESAWLAMCYFMKGTQITIANDLLEGVIAQQVTSDPNPGKEGNFKWYYEETGVDDYNCVSFVGPVLAFIYNNYYEDLEGGVASSLATCLSNADPCVSYLGENRIAVWYTNVYINLINYHILRGNETKPIKWTNKLYTLIKDSGINEYCPWAYYSVQLAGFQSAYKNAADSNMKEQLKEMLELHWYDFAHNLHKDTKMLSSVASRAKVVQGLTPHDNVKTLCYLYFEDGSIANIDDPETEMLMSNYEPPAAVQSIYKDKSTTEYQLHYSRVDAHVYQTPTYSLSTQSGRRSRLGYTDTLYQKKISSSRQLTEEADIQLVYSCTTGPYNGVRFSMYDVDYTVDDFNHHWITSVQKENKAVSSFSFDPNGRTWDKIYSEVCLGVTELVTANNILINGSRWDGNDTALTTGAIIAYKVEDVYIGIRFLDTDVIRIDNHSICTTSQPISLTVEEIQEGDYGEGYHKIMLRSYLAYDTSRFAFTQTNRRLGYVIEMATTSDYATLSSFSDHMKGIIINQGLNSNIHEVTVKSGDDTLYLKEDLEKDQIISRKINNTEYNNWYLLKSKYVSQELGQDLGSITVSTSGALSYPASTPPASQDTYIYAEAEDMILESPMTIESFSGASNSYVIKTTITKQGSAGLTVNIPFTGNWKVWVRVYFADTGKNSFFVRFNNSNEGYKNEIVTNTTYGVFQWIECPTTYYLHRGTHALIMDGRETDSRLDKVLVTNDLSFDPIEKQGDGVQIEKQGDGGRA